MGEDFDFRLSSDGEHAEGEHVVILHQLSARPDSDDPLDELRLLATSAGATVVQEIVTTRRKPEPATFIGKGKVEELADVVRMSGASLVIIDHAISPVQERNLEKEIKARVLDRTGLILDIFAQRASSAEGKLQVELAQLRHLSTRLVRGWTHLERQKGGIGLRGPGETQLESDRRMIGMRIRTLRKRLDRLEAQRGLRRRARERVPVPTVSLVGYTNAGKSSLFNKLTAANVSVADQLFHTLDPTMRRLEVEGYGEIVLSDTVGFVRDLPHSLVTAFHSTLEEVASASMLIHVVDAGSPECEQLIEEVNRVLGEIDALNVPVTMVYNKIDTTGDAPRVQYEDDGTIRAVWLSALTGEGIEGVHEAITATLGKDRKRMRCVLPPHLGRLRAGLFERCQIVDEQVGDEGQFQLELLLDEAVAGWLRAQPEFEDDFLQDAA